MKRERVTRGQMSRIDQLPPEIKSRVDELLRSGTTQVEILRRLEKPLSDLGEPPLSRSGLNRYASRFAEVGQDLRELNAIADAWTSKLGEEPTGNVGALTIQVLRSLSFKATMRARSLARDEDADLGELAELIGDLALQQQRLERSANLNLARERELRKAVAAQAADRAAESAETAARESGLALPAEVLQRIRRDVYGIRDAV